MNSFFNGFTDELVKEAGHPLFSTVTKGGTIFGKKVKGLMRRSMKKAKKVKVKMQKRLTKKSQDMTQRGQAPAPKIPRAQGMPPAAQPMPAPTTNPTKPPLAPKPAMPMNKSAEEDAGDALRDFLERVVEEAQNSADDYHAQPLEDDKYGGGTGNFKGRQAPKFTPSTKGGKPGNPTENPERFGAGCGMKR